MHAADPWLALVRAIHFAAVIALFGQLAYLFLVARGRERPPHFLPLAAWSTGVALASSALLLKSSEAQGQADVPGARRPRQGSAAATGRPYAKQDWLPPGMPEQTRAFLRFHCGCALVTEPRDAIFVAVPAGHAAPAMSACAQGDPEYPDRSATLLIEVEALSGRLPARAP